MICYVLLTHGKKPERDKLPYHPAAKQQLANLTAFRTRMEARSDGNRLEVQLLFDYCRDVQELRSLPTLRKLLEAAREQKTTVVIDDIGRLFRAASADRRQTLAEEIEPYSEHLWGLRQYEYFAELDHRKKVPVIAGLQSGSFRLAKPPAKRRSAKARKAQTEDATQASITARGRIADNLAKELDQVRQNLMRDGTRPTFKEIAEEANRRGLNTSRGGIWTSSSVGRILGRLGRPSLTERARKLRDAKKTPGEEPEAR